MTEVNGHWDVRFDAVRDKFAENIASGEDVGASFAVTIDGEMVIDIWGGHLDKERRLPWEKDTIVNVYSSTKTMCFLCALVLADRGLIDFDARVADYWPEFAANGKEGVLVWHLMAHAAGLSGLDEMVGLEDLYNWDYITGLLAAQAPWWQPGTASGYHALTQGYLIGELVRRVTGKSLGRFFREEIAEPLAADFYIGVPESEFHRIGNLIPPDTSSSAVSLGGENSIAARTFNSPSAGSPKNTLTPGWRKAEIPAANGHGNARAIARLQSPLACGGTAFGVTLMSKETAKAALTERIAAKDLVLGVPLRFGLGFGLNSEVVPMSPNPNTGYWGGWGGSSVLVDQDARISASFVMNRMIDSILGDRRSYDLVQTLYSCL